MVLQNLLVHLRLVIAQIGQVAALAGLGRKSDQLIHFLDAVPAVFYDVDPKGGDDAKFGIVCGETLIGVVGNPAYPVGAVGDAEAEHVGIYAGVCVGLVGLCGELQLRRHISQQLVALLLAPKGVIVLEVIYVHAHKGKQRLLIIVQKLSGLLKEMGTVIQPGQGVALI